MYRAVLCVVLSFTLFVSCSDDTTGGIDAEPIADLGVDGPLADQALGTDQAMDVTTAPDQSIPMSWAVSAGGTGLDRGMDIVVDSAGNSYITGGFEGTASFGSTTLIAKGLSDAFVAKLDSAGKWLWAVSTGSTGADHGTGITVDSAGNAYITGGFSGTASFGSTTLAAKGLSDAFVAKLDSSGKWLWAVSAGGNSLDSGNDISVDSSGNSHVTGGMMETGTFGSTILTSKGMDDIFVAKLDSSGKWLWAVSAGGPNMEGGWGGISVDSAGNSYLTKSFGGTASFGSISLTSKGSGDIFVAKLDSAGKWQWAVSAGGTGVDQGWGISVDSAGNSTITGNFNGAVSFGATSLDSKGQSGLFVARLDSTGKWLWATSTGGGSNNAMGVSVDSAGNSYLTGSYGGMASFGSTSLIYQGENDLFVAKLDSAGKWLWAVSAGGTKTDNGIGISVDSAGNSYVTGEFTGTASFDSTALTSKGGFDLFVWKVSK